MLWHCWLGEAKGIQPVKMPMPIVSLGFSFGKKWREKIKGHGGDPGSPGKWPCGCVCMSTDPPGAPRNLKVSDVTKTSCKLTWTAPESDGGSPVTGYQVEKFTGTKWIRAVKKPVAECSFAFDDLLEASENEFRVCAENAAGVGPPSETTGRFVAKDPFEVPGRPDAPEVKDRTENQATLTFKAPDSDGGSPIVGYVVEMKGKLETKWKVIGKDVKDLEFVATGLQPDAECEFRVAAVNKAGQGQASPPSKHSKYGKQRWVANVVSCRFPVFNIINVQKKP